MSSQHGGYSVGGGETPPQKTTDFRYAFFDLANDPDCKLSPDSATVRPQLEALAEQMAVEPSPVPPAPIPPDDGRNSMVPSGFTYLGQFIDHDITASLFVDPLAASDIFEPFDPVDPAVVESSLRNERMPRLELDSVYGEGPGSASSGHFYESDGVRLRLGECVSDGIPGDPPNPDIDGPGTAGLRNDLPRDADRAPEIADGRNDENLVIAQLHVGFLRFHNAVADALEARDGLSGAELFAAAQREVRYHYQWLVLHDYLPNVVGKGAVYRGALDATTFISSVVGRQHALPFMPLEFSAAAFRFGHSMIRAVYDWNRNFGSAEPGFPSNPPAPLLPNAPFNLLFKFTGKNGLTPGTGVSPQLPFNWIARWPRLFFTPNATVAPERFARRFDTHLAQPLTNIELLTNGVDPPIPPALNIEAHLAKRNLLRGYWLSLPTGQCLARAFGIEPLTPDEVRSGNEAPTNAIIDGAGFAEKTPLWYYILKEAEVRENGHRLGELGGRIVAGTLVGLLLTDPETSFMTEAWTPDRGIVKEKLGRFRTMSDMLEFAGVAPPAVVPAVV